MVLILIVIPVFRFETKEHKHNSVRAVIDRKGL